MSVQIRRRGDTTAAHSSFVGAAREITIDTDKHCVVVHDGETAGGFPLLREDLANFPAASWEQIRQFIEDKLIGTIAAAPLDFLSGFLLCNGAEVSRASYAKLFARIGTTFGAGDGETTFAIPDYRGFFLRGKGGNSAADFSTAQSDQFQGHSHHSDIREHVYGSGDGAAVQRTNGTDEGLHYDSPDMHIYEPMTYGSYEAARFGTETRQKNKAVNFFIKY